MLQLPLKRSPKTEAALIVLGLDGKDTQVALQSDVYKELINKLAWVIGSTYNAPYNNTRTQARATAIEVAGVLITTHGWPNKIGYPK